MKQNELVLQAALKYRAMGFSVIPVLGKRPPIQWKDFQYRIALEEEVIKWFETYPAANIAIVTGPISELVVVDVDEGADISKLVLPQTVVVKTGGYGFHYYYKYPKDKTVPSTAGVIDKVDIRGMGGYVVAPPSIHISGNRYEFAIPPEDTEISVCPIWLYEKNNTREKSSFSQVIHGVVEGSRNDSAATVIGKFLYSFEPSDWESTAWPSLIGWNLQNNPPLANAELRKVYESVKKIELERRNKSTNQTTNSNDSSTYPELIKISDLLQLEIPDQEWIVENLIPKGGIAILSGKPKVAKSWLTLDMALNIAIGIPFLGKFKTEASNILYISMDEGIFLTAKRAQQFITENEQPKLIYTQWPDLKLDSFDKLPLLKQIVQSERVGLVIIDSLRRVISGDENDSRVINRLQHSFKSLMDLGVTIFSIHHQTKDYMGINRSGLEKLRGSSDIGAMVDTHLMLEKTKNGQLKLTQTVLRMQPELPPMLINLPSQDNKHFAFSSFLDNEEDKPKNKLDEAKFKVIYLLQNGPLTQKDLIESILADENLNIKETTIKSAIVALEKEKTIKTYKPQKEKMCELISQNEVEE